MGKRLVVNYKELGDFSKYLSEKSEEFKNIRTNIMTLVNNIKNSWDGKDSANFISNANSYLESLSVVESNMSSFSNFAGKKLSSYSKVSNEYMENSKREVM